MSAEHTHCGKATSNSGPIARRCRQAAALGWITQLLRARQIPFLVVGGLAARAYGATRPLFDLDFYVPTTRMAKIASAIRIDSAARVLREDEPYCDAVWDLRFLAVEYHGQRIELGGAEGARYFDRQAGVWRDAAVDWASSVSRVVLGHIVPVMPKVQLLAYKRAHDREVDRLDLAELERSASQDSAVT